MFNPLRPVMSSLYVCLAVGVLVFFGVCTVSATQTPPVTAQPPLAVLGSSQFVPKLVADGEPSASSLSSDSRESRDSSLQYVTIYMSWYPQSQFAGYIMAIEKGFFKSRGLEVELKWAALGQRPLVALAKGEVEFASGWLSTGMTVAANEPRIINILQLHQRSASLLVAKSDVQSLRDLNGQTLLSWGGDFRVEFDLFLKKNGIQPGRVLPLSSSLAPFINKLVSGTQAMEYNEIFRLVERGMREDELRVFRLDEYGVNMLGDGLYTREELWQRNPNMVRAVRDAVVEGWQYALAHEAETVEAVMEYAERSNQRTNATHQRKMLRVIAELITHHGWDDPRVRGDLVEADFDRCKALLVEAGEPVEQLEYRKFFVRP